MRVVDGVDERGLEIDELTRIASAWRELRRWGTSAAVREHIVTQFGVDQGQLDFLEQIAQSQPIAMAALATALRVDASSATRAVHRLVARGLVQRRNADGDARRVEVEPTTEGYALVREVERARREWLDDVLCDATAAERREIVAGMERLVQALCVAEGRRDGVRSR